MAPQALLVSSICSECGAPLEFPLGAMQVRCEHCDAGLAVDAGQRLLRLDCPRCRGNFYYIDGALCGKCPYCDAPLLALTRDRLLRYLVRPQAPCPEEGARLQLLPFWHLAGLVYAWDIGNKIELVDERAGPTPSYGTTQSDPDLYQVERRDTGPQRVFRGRVVNLSMADPATLAMGVAALGVRGSVFPIEPFSAEAEGIGEVVTSTLAADRARESLLARALDLAHSGLTSIDLQRADLVAECLSLFYYPCWVSQGPERKLWDGVSGQPERLCQPGPAPASGGTPVFDELRIVELTCTSCGAPLLPGNHSQVLPCSACGQHWQVAGQGLVACEAFAARPLRAPSGPVSWLPFWRVEVTISYGGREASRAGQLREVLGLHIPAAQLPAAPPSSPLAFYVPAYGALRAPRLDVAARDMTRLQPLLEPATRDAGEVYNCFLGAEDAARLGYATLMQLLPPVVKRLRSLRLKPSATTLWYVPFEESDRELGNLLTGMRYDRTAFRGVRH